MSEDGGKATGTGAAQESGEDAPRKTGGARTNLSPLPDTYKRLKAGVVAIGGPVTQEGEPFKYEGPPVQQGGPMSIESTGLSPFFTGTGFCVDSRGIIVTCKHVLTTPLPSALLQAAATSGVVQNVEAVPEQGNGGASQGLIEVREFPLHAIFFYENGNDYVGRAVPGGPIFFHPVLDIAVFRLQDPHFARPDIQYPVVSLGDSATLTEGETVAACGFPFGHQFREISSSVNSSLCVGIVSAILPAPPAIRTRAFKAFQMDMSTTGGYSGGPVFRPDTGEVVGIVSSVIEHRESGVPFGITFGIPINLAKPGIKHVQQLTQQRP